MEKILVLDDDQVILALIESSLNQEGFQVYTFNKGIDALTDLQTNQYDLIISDLMMPEMDGESFFCKVREQYPKVPFVFLTANESVDTAVKVMKLGADDYIQKPIKGQNLIDRVNGAIQEKKRELFIKKTLDDNYLDSLEQNGSMEQYLYP